MTGLFTLPENRRRLLCRDPDQRSPDPNAPEFLIAIPKQRFPTQMPNRASGLPGWWIRRCRLRGLRGGCGFGVGLLLRGRRR